MDASLDQLSETGERIEGLLSALSTGGPIAQQRAEDLVALVTNLYGAGLERMLDVLADAGRLDQVALDALAADQLVSGLLLVHGLHPHDVGTRVATALDSVRPYLGSHGGDVELLGVDAAGVVRLRLLGSCDSCPSSSVTLQLAVEGAIQSCGAGGRLDRGGGPDQVGGRADLGGFVAGPAGRRRRRGGLARDARARRAGPRRDRRLRTRRAGPGRLPAGAATCSRTAITARRAPQTLAGARLERRLGDSADNLILVCPHCHTRYDARRAGVALDSDHHLEPLPVLRRDGVLSVAVPVGV